MDNKAIRSLAKDRMKGKMLKALGISALYWLIIFGGTLILGFIPIVGSLIASILTTPLAFGWTKQLIELENGQNVGLVDFISHGFANFGKVWCSGLWIALKAMVGIIALILAGLLTTVNEVLGIVATLVATIVTMVVMYKYIMINYTIAYDNSNMRARDLVRKTAEEAKGKVWKFLCMGIYYGLLMFAIYFVVILVATFISALIPALAVIIMPAALIVVAVMMVRLSLLSVAASNEFYKINVLGMINGDINNVAYNPVQNMDQNNYGYNPTQDMNQNNYSYNPTQNDYGSPIDMNNNSQSNDFFNNQQ